MIEQSVLSIILNFGSEYLDEAMSNGLTPECFEDALGRIIFESMLKLQAKNIPIDIASVGMSLGDKVPVHELTHLLSVAETTTQLVYFVKILVARSRKRKILTALLEAQETLKKADEVEMEDAVAIVDKLQSKLDIISSDTTDNEYTAQNAVEQAFKDLQHANGTSYTPTGLNSLDGIIFGFSPQDMVVLAGRPSTGKTAFALTIADNIIRQKPQAPILFFTYEMSYVKLMKRMICLDAKINSRAIENNVLSSVDKATLGQSRKLLSNSRFTIIDNPNLTIEAVQRYVRTCKRKYGKPALIVIDYLQLIPATDRRIHREQQVAHISRQVKMLAKDADCPVLVLSQFSRACEQEDRDPRKSDLRESGSIEQDADKILLLSPILTAYGDEPNVKLIVSKNRDGSVGSTKVSFLKHITRYADPPYQPTKDANVRT